MYLAYGLIVFGALLTINGFRSFLLHPTINNISHILFGIIILHAGVFLIRKVRKRNEEAGKKLEKNLFFLNLLTTWKIKGIISDSQFQILKNSILQELGEKVTDLPPPIEEKPPLIKEPLPITPEPLPIKPVPQPIEENEKGLPLKPIPPDIIPKPPISPPPPRKPFSWKTVFSEENIRWLLGIGVFLMVAAAFIFVRYEWVRFVPWVRVSILLITTLLAFLIGLFLIFRLKIYRAGIALLILTSILFPINVWYFLHSFTNIDPDLIVFLATLLSTFFYIFLSFYLKDSLFVYLSLAGLSTLIIEIAYKYRLIFDFYPPIMATLALIVGVLSHRIKKHIHWLKRGFLYGAGGLMALSLSAIVIISLVEYINRNRPFEHGALALTFLSAALLSTLYCYVLKLPFFSWISAGLLQIAILEGITALGVSYLYQSPYLMATGGILLYLSRLSKVKTLWNDFFKPLNLFGLLNCLLAIILLPFNPEPFLWTTLIGAIIFTLLAYLEDSLPYAWGATLLLVASWFDAFYRGGLYGFTYRLPFLVNPAQLSLAIIPLALLLIGIGEVLKRLEKRITIAQPPIIMGYGLTFLSLILSLEQEGVLVVVGLICTLLYLLTAYIYSSPVFAWITTSTFTLSYLFSLHFFEAFRFTGYRAPFPFYEGLGSLSWWLFPYALFLLIIGHMIKLKQTMFKEERLELFDLPLRSFGWGVSFLSLLLSLSHPNLAISLGLSWAIIFALGAFLTTSPYLSYAFSLSLSYSYLTLLYGFDIYNFLGWRFPLFTSLYNVALGIIPLAVLLLTIGYLLERGLNLKELGGPVMRVGYGLTFLSIFLAIDHPSAAFWLTLLWGLLYGGTALFNRSLRFGFASLITLTISYGYAYWLTSPFAGWGGLGDFVSASWWWTPLVLALFALGYHKREELSRPATLLGYILSLPVIIFSLYSYHSRIWLFFTFALVYTFTAYKKGKNYFAWAGALLLTASYIFLIYGGMGWETILPYRPPTLAALLAPYSLALIAVGLKLRGELQNLFRPPLWWIGFSLTPLSLILALPHTPTFGFLSLLYALLYALVVFLTPSSQPESAFNTRSLPHFMAWASLLSLTFSYGALIRFDIGTFSLHWAFPIALFSIFLYVIFLISQNIALQKKAELFTIPALSLATILTATSLILGYLKYPDLSTAVNLGFLYLLVFIGLNRFSLIYKHIFAYGSIIFFYLGYYTFILARDIKIYQPYTYPLALGLLVYLLTLGRQVLISERRRWYLLFLALIIFPTIIQMFTVPDGMGRFGLIMALEGVTLFALGLVLRNRILFFGGIGALLLNVGIQSFVRLWAEHKTILWGGLGLILILVAVALELKRGKLLEKSAEITRFMEDWE